MRATIKLTIRSIRASLARYLALLLIVFLGVGFFAGLKVTRSAMTGTCAQYLRQQNFSDLQLISTLGLTEGDVRAFAALDGIEKAEGTVSVDVMLEVRGHAQALRLHALPQSINRPRLVAGRLPKKKDECLADDRLFSEKDIGRTLKVVEDSASGDGVQVRSDELTITGLCSSPLYLGRDRGSTSIGSGTLQGFLYVPKETLKSSACTGIDLTFSEERTIYSSAYDRLAQKNRKRVRALLESRAKKRYEDLADEIVTSAQQRALVQVQAEAAMRIPVLTPKKTRQKILDEMTRKALEAVPSRKELIRKAGLQQADLYVLTRRQNAGYVSFESDTSILSGIADLFPLFFVAIGMLVCVTTMSRMVEEDRTQIGTLKALGYSDAAVTARYLLYAGSATVLGWLLGFFGGTLAIPRLFWLAYSSQYNFAPLIWVFSPSLAAITLAVSLAGILGSTWIACRRDLQDTPAALIRPRSLKAGKRILLERVRPLWRHLTFLQKITLRNMFRYKQRLAMMVAGIGCCTALIVTSFGVGDTMAPVAERQYTKIQHYDLEAGFDPEKTDQAALEKKLGEMDAVKGFLPCRLLTVDLSGKGSSGPSMTSVPLYSLTREDSRNLSAFWTLRRDGQGLSFPGRGEALVSRKIAEKLGLSAGDVLIIRDADLQELKVRVSGIFDNTVGNSVFVRADTCREGFGTARANAFLLRVQGSAKGTAERLTRIDGIRSITSLAEAREKVDTSLDCLGYIITLMVLFSGALAFLVTFNLTNINLAERSREIATVEVLGFYPRETSSYVLRENVILSVLASLIGLPVGTAFHHAVMRLIVIDAMAFDLTIRPGSYLLAVVCTIAFSLIVDLFMRRQIRRISMAESLKAVE